MPTSALRLLDELIGDVAGKGGAAAATTGVAAAPPSSAPKAEAEVDAALEGRLQLLRSVGEECVTETELRGVLKKASFVLYDGFEPSGRMHIAQGVFKAMNVNKCTAAGGR